MATGEAKWMMIYDLFMMLDILKICKWSKIPANPEDLDDYVDMWSK